MAEAGSKHERRVALACGAAAHTAGLHDRRHHRALGGIALQHVWAEAECAGVRAKEGALGGEMLDDGLKRGARGRPHG